MIPLAIRNASQIGDKSQAQPKLRVYSCEKNPENIENPMSHLFCKESEPVASMQSLTPILMFDDLDVLIVLRNMH